MKTNAVRALQADGIAFVLHAYKADDGGIDALSVAAKIGVEPHRLFKTLVARSEHGEILVYCIPGSTELDLKKAAAAASTKSVKLVRVAELKELTGYERGGCSPFGMRRHYPLLLDESVFAFEKVLVSGGAIGLQIELSPVDLRRVTKAEVANLV